jgi:hypothetical protein
MRLLFAAVHESAVEAPECRGRYLRYRGEKNVNGKLWENLVLEDFDELRKIGLARPLMDEIESRFAAGR